MAITIKLLQPIEKILPFICTIWVPKIRFPYRKWIHIPHAGENHWKFWSFHYHNRNVNPIISKNGDGKNSLFVIQGAIIFPHSRLSSRSKKKFPHSRLRRSWENFFLLLLLRLSWGNIIVPFMTHREFLFPILAASPLVGEISRPHFLKWWDWANVIYTKNGSMNFGNFCLCRFM